MKPAPFLNITIIPAAIGAWTGYRLAARPLEQDPMGTIQWLTRETGIAVLAGFIAQGPLAPDPSWLATLFALNSKGGE